MVSLTDIEEAKDEAQTDGLRDNNAGIPDGKYDYTEHDAPLVKCHPESIVAFDEIVDFGVFNSPDGFLDLEQNLEGAGPNNYGNQAFITLKNPQLENGILWDEEHNFRDHRVITLDDNPVYSYNFEEVNGSPTKNGVDIGFGEFSGDEVGDTIDNDYIQILIPARRASSFLGVLDTAGHRAVNGGEYQGGLIEVPPQMERDDMEYNDDEHGAPRAIGYPELRQDLVGQQGLIAWTFDDENPDQYSPISITVCTVADDGSVEALTPLTPEQSAFAKPTYPRRGNLVWDHGLGDGAGGRAADSPSPPTETENTPDSPDGIDEISLDSSDVLPDVDGNESQPTVDDLSETDTEIVVSLRQELREKDATSVTDVDNFGSVLDAYERKRGIDADRATIETVIENGL